MAGRSPVRAQLSRPLVPDTSPATRHPAPPAALTTTEVTETRAVQSGTAGKKAKVKKTPRPPPIKVEERGTAVGPSLAGSSHTTSDGETFPQPAGNPVVIAAAGTAEEPAGIELHSEQPVQQHREPLAAIGGGQQSVVKQEAEGVDGTVRPCRRRDPNAPKPVSSVPPAEVIDLSSTSSEDEQEPPAQ